MFYQTATFTTHGKVTNGVKERRRDSIDGGVLLKIETLTGWFQHEDHVSNDLVTIVSSHQSKNDQLR